MYRILASLNLIPTLSSTTMLILTPLTYAVDCWLLQQCQLHRATFCPHTTTAASINITLCHTVRHSTQVFAVPPHRPSVRSCTTAVHAPQSMQRPGRRIQPSPQVSPPNAAPLRAQDSGLRWGTGWGRRRWLRDGFRHTKCGMTIACTYSRQSQYSTSQWQQVGCE